ncbi:recombination mediator RecR [bacterium]
MQYTITLTHLINTLKKLPGIGPKTAERLAFYILKMPREEVLAFANNLVKVKDNISYCGICGSITEQDPCAICINENRSKSTICVVEEPNDVWAIEKTNEFKGNYHVLGGVISPLDNISPDDLRIKELLERVKTKNINEVILATNPTVTGEATAIYLSKILKPLAIKITRIAHGIPIGSDLEYTDGLTIAKALEGRREI